MDMNEETTAKASTQAEPETIPTEEKASEPG